MIHILAASSLSHSVKDLRELIKRTQVLTAIPELHRVESSDKFPAKQFKTRYNLKQNEKVYDLEIIIWHDAVNNSLTPPHSSNNNNPPGSEQLVQIQKLPCGVRAIVYSRQLI